MSGPDFWHQHNWLSALLSPLAAIYADIHEGKWRRANPQRVDAPVVCVGNLTVGGTGKTPVVRALRDLAAARGLDAHVLLRGHGGRLHGLTRVDWNFHAADDVGDEALLHAQDGPTWIARDRVAGARAAADAGADLIIMDDGFQNPSLVKDFSFVVIDGRTGFGNGHVFPAGPLRERPDFGLGRADAVIMMGPGATPRAVERCGLPVLCAGLVPSDPAPEGNLYAFAGIGRPEKFYDSLKDCGGRIVKSKSFNDHHRFSEHELSALRRRAKDFDARLITTEKDYARLPRCWRQNVLVWPVEAAFDNAETLNDMIAPVMDGGGKAA